MNESTLDGAKRTRTEWQVLLVSSPVPDLGGEKGLLIDPVPFVKAGTGARPFRWHEEKRLMRNQASALSRILRQSSLLYKFLALLSRPTPIAIVATPFSPGVASLAHSGQKLV